MDHRQLGVDLYNGVWPLLEAGDERAVHQAHASAWHWAQVGAPENLVRSEWLCSRVYAVLGRAEPARHHAERALALCTQHGVADWDLAVVHEALARAAVVAGDPEQARAQLATARAVPVADPDDLAVVEADLAAVEALL